MDWELTQDEAMAVEKAFENRNPPRIRVRSCPRIKPGTIIRVHGWVMMDKLDAGLYRVSRVSEYHGKLTYHFTRPRGRKEIVRHYCDSVDAWVRPSNHPDLNRIEILE